MKKLLYVTIWASILMAVVSSIPFMEMQTNTYELNFLFFKSCGLKFLNYLPILAAIYGTMYFLNKKDQFIFSVININLPFWGMFLIYHLGDIERQKMAIFSEESIINFVAGLPICILFFIGSYSTLKRIYKPGSTETEINGKENSIR